MVFPCFFNTVDYLPDIARNIKIGKKENSVTIFDISKNQWRMYQTLFLSSMIANSRIAVSKSILLINFYGASF